MRTSVLNLVEFVQTIDKRSSIDDLTTKMLSALAPFGVSSISANLIITPGKILKPGIMFGHHWDEWSQRYRREGFSASDPAVRLLRDQSRPFAWSEAARRFDSPAARRVMGACAETTGSHEGFVVPVREADGALLSAAFSGEAVDLAADARAAMHLAGYYYVTHGRALLQGIELQASVRITPRQAECLSWVLRGKTDREIAAILNLSARTVHHHIELAMDRMGVSKRTLAAHEAWRQGWLD